MRDADGQLVFLRGFLRVAWFALAACLLGWLAWKNLPPSGRLTAVGRTAEPSGFFGGFTPLDRAVPTQDGGAWYSDIAAEPVYFNVAAPRLYDTMRVKLRYKEEGQPYVALGVRTDPKAWAFDLRPIDLPMLDASGWSARQAGEMRIYERRATARTAQDILEATADHTAVIAVDPVRWGLKLPPLKREHPVEAVTSYAGSRKIYVYAQNAPFEMTLGLKGPDEVAAKVSLVRDGKTLLTRTHEGDGAVELTLSGAEPGLYRVDVDAPDSVTLVGLRTPHQRVAFVDTDGVHLKAPAGAADFEPEFPVVTWQTDLAKAPYDTIVARYRPPTVEADGWRTAEAEFDLGEVSISSGQAQMLLSLPALKAVGGKLRVDRVDLEYARPPFEASKLLDLFKLQL
jgi:hypothetical protein